MNYARKCVKMLFLWLNMCLNIWLHKIKFVSLHQRKGVKQFRGFKST